MLISIILGLVLSAGGNNIELDERGERFTISCEGVTMQQPELARCVLYSASEPDRSYSGRIPFPSYYESCIRQNFRGYEGNIKEAYNPVSLNTSGKSIYLDPEKIVVQENGSISILFYNDCFSMEENWSVSGEDILVRQVLHARKAGWYSIQSPSIASIDKNDFAWAAVPGYFQSDHFNRESFDLAYNYGDGLPDAPVICRERSVTTICSYVTDSRGITLAASAAPGQGRNPWQGGINTNRTCCIGVSLQNRAGEFCPTIWRPVLGEEGSFLNPGEETSLQTVFTIRKSDWYPVFKHIVMDINGLEKELSKRKTELSLTERLFRMKEYVLSDSLSLWRNVSFNGRIIGAQDYLGFVYGAERDAMKNADYGAMWMLASVTGDPRLVRDRLPYAKSFKMEQQADSGESFPGAPRGQYYLYNSGRFTEEFGDYTEPVADTYYMLMDLGNIALFEPHDRVLRKRIRLAADRLLEWMYPDGHWEVAYSNADKTPVFTDLKDCRPTFYGLLVAYRILGDKKYLKAAKTAAEWLKENAVDRGYYLGVCGDTRFLRDFATAQCARAFYELYDITGERRYQETASRVLQQYTNQIFTHSFPDGEDNPEISQKGLNFEHASTFGSCIAHGPVLLASHAGLFIREYGLTRDTMMLDMARLAVSGRDSFVEKKSGVASYYWYAMDRGSGPFPHHAWWQIGWIMDYLISEAYIRSGGKIDFPSGFMAPKVGPHVTYGFKPGRINGKKAYLCMKEGYADVDNPYIECITAKNRSGRVVYAILLNASPEEQAYCVKSEVDGLSHTGILPPYGLEVLTLRRRVPAGQSVSGLDCSRVVS